MANLLSTCTSESGNIQHISPQNAGWEYVGFDVWQLKARRPIWKRRTITVSIHLRDSAYSASTPTIAAWMNVWRSITGM